MASHADSQNAPGRFSLLRKWGVLALVIAVLGLPLNHLFAYAIVMIAAVIVFVGTVTARMRPWLMSVLVCIVAVAGQALLKPPPIDEGHNVFLPGGQDNALLAKLPPEVYRLMAAEFDKLYPPQQRCDPSKFGCWRNAGVPDRLYAFSADGVFDNPAFSREVYQIDFDDVTWLRLGFTNTHHYNWIVGISDVSRLKRDRNWLGLGRWQVTMPFFVMYRFPAAYVGSNLCWQGDVIWEDRTDQFTRLSNPLWACRTIEPADVGRRIFGMAIKPGSLAMSLEPTVTLQIRGAAGSALIAIAVVSILSLLVRWQRRRAILPFTLLGLSLAVIAFVDMSFIGGFRPLDGGDDGLFYEGLGRDIVQHLLAGDIAAALRGGESVFHYGGPGLRYLRAVERFIFGDTNLGYLSLILLLPIAVFALYRRFLPNRWGLALAMIFIAIPAGALFGTTYYSYARWAARGFADPASYAFVFFGVLFLTARGAERSRALWHAFAASFLMSMGVFVRPNVAPFVGIMLCGAGLWALQEKNWRRILGLAAGTLPIVAMPLHNWYFGHRFVLFSANVTTGTHVGLLPSGYLDAMRDLVHFDFDGPALSKAVAQIAGWLAGPSESYLMIPLHIVALLVLVRVLLSGRYERWIRWIAAATIMQHAPALFYAPSPRYYLLTWFFTGFVGAVWLRNEGIAWLQRRFPRSWDQARLNRLSREVERVMRRFEVIIGLTRFPRRSAARG